MEYKEMLEELISQGYSKEHAEKVLIDKAAETALIDNPTEKDANETVTVIEKKSACDGCPYKPGMKTCKSCVNNSEV